MAYTKEQKDTMFKDICKRISDGEPLRKILNEKGTLSNTIFYELLEDSDKNEQYARACELRADILFEEIIEIADKQDKDVIQTKEGKIINHNIINRNRLQVDARKWILSKMNPKKYGDRITQNHEGDVVIKHQNVSKQFPDR